MKKILVPVDFSQHTAVSCSFALGIAEETGAEITLFHSFFEQIYFADGGFSTGFESGIMLTDDIILDFYKQKEQKLAEMAASMGDTARKAGKPVTINYIIETGDPQHQILNAIGKLNPCMVIMGSSGMGRKSFLTGSVCKKVMDNCDTPVMAIPDIPEFNGLHNIIYATDIEQDDTAALNHIFNLFEGYDITVHCLHLNIHNKEKRPEARMEALKQDNRLEGIKSKIIFRVMNCDEPKKCLVKYITEQNIQLITFVPHKKNFFTIFSRQELSKEDLFMAGLPILGIS